MPVKAHHYAVRNHNKGGGRTVTDTTQPEHVESEPAAPERREFFKTAATVGVGAAVLGKFAAASTVAAAQAGATPALSDKPWWPSRWGKDDEAGATNWVTPARVLEAAKLIKTGKVYRIGRVYEQGMPLFGARAFSLRIPGSPTGGPFGANKLVYHDEFLATEIGQVGTQFDGLGHIGIQMGKDGDKTEMRYYNGFTEQEIGDAYGLKKLGVEKLNPLFCRCHLVDVVPLKGRPWEVGEEITAANVIEALRRVNIAESDIREGDGVMFNTGWGQLWMKNNERFNSGEPGIGVEVARWITSKGLCVIGSDTWATEVVPNPDKNLAFPVHGEVITKHGIPNHENLNFDGLIADRAYQFVYCFVPSPIKGATGSNGSPIAIA
jgi:kynurenine formamidase